PPPDCRHSVGWSRPVFSHACAIRRRSHLQCGSALSRCEAAFADRVPGFGMVCREEPADFRISDLASVSPATTKLCREKGSFGITRLDSCCATAITDGSRVPQDTAAKHLAMSAR